MTSFIRALEVWVPSNDRSMLEFGGGHYGAATRFAAISRELCFGRGEGLPGQAWEAGHPIVLKEFEGSYFRRIAAARAEGLTCGIAVPIFAGDFLNAVMVIFCGDDAAHAGAIELWHNDPHESHDMTLVDGCYGSTGDTFEFISRSVSFRRGTGLPGMAWPGSSRRRCSLRTSAAARASCVPTARSRSASTAASRCRARHPATSTT